jgi:hypothetical protein
LSHRIATVCPPRHHPDPFIPEFGSCISPSLSTWASCLSIASAFQRLLSLSIDDADARKPWLVMSSFLKPMRRKAAFRVFSDMQRVTDLADGNRNLHCPVSFPTSLRIETARGASGTRCALRIFIRPAGISQTAASSSNSSHSAARNSPGRTKVRASNSSAARVSYVPS